VIFAAEPGATDPLALIIAIGGAAVSSLLLLVTSLIAARAKRAEGEIKGLSEVLLGRLGMTVQLAAIEGRLNTHEKAIEGLEKDTLSKEQFERATYDQNNKLDDLRFETKDLGKKVEKIDKSIAARPWSQTGFPASRAPGQQREDPESEPPVPPMRPRLPSRQPR
jgi:hypothetical protein